MNKKVYLCTHETTDIFVDAPVWDDDSMGAGVADRRTADGKTDAATVRRTSAEREDGQYRGHQP